MKRSIRAMLVITAALSLAAPGAAQETRPTTQPAADAGEVCVLKTSLGTMVFRFYDDVAPRTAAHFRELVRDGFYDGRKFYRVVAGHVIQAGAGDDTERPTVAAEFNDRPHVPGTVGLARSEDPDSGSTEFYICLAPRPHLDGRYTLFGELIEGRDVLTAIGAVEVNEKFVADGKVAFHEPKAPVVIETATIERRGD